MRNLKYMVTVGVLAKLLEVHPDTIRNWADNGKIRCYNHPCNGYRIFDLDEVREDLKIPELGKVSE